MLEMEHAVQKLREYRKKRKWNEESKEGNCMEKGHGGSKLSFGTVSAQALSKSYRKVRR